MRHRRWGAIAVIVGGALEVFRVVLTQFVFPSIAAPRVTATVVALAPTLLIAVGLLAVGLSYNARGRLAFLIAAIFGLLLVAVNAAQILLASPLGPAPSQLAIALHGASTAAAAVILLSDRSVLTPDRWSLTLPAGCMLLVVLGMSLLPWTALAVLPAVGYIFGGYLVLRTTRELSTSRRAGFAEAPSSRDGVESHQTKGG